ncbi:hypothetical protein TrLO_g15975 [Triparma laevis f. longispina]|nr:hypothetical protein TrLO_g15975 [Triparma laevis f. longispina]
MHEIKIEHPNVDAHHMNTLLEEEIELRESLKLISSLSTIESLKSRKTYEAWETQFLLVLNLSSSIGRIHGDVDPNLVSQALDTLSTIKKRLILALNTALNETIVSPSSPHLIKLHTLDYFHNTHIAATYSNYLRTSITNLWITYLTPHTDGIQPLITRLSVWDVDDVDVDLAVLRLEALKSVVQNTLERHPPQHLTLPALTTLLTLLPHSLTSAIDEVTLALAVAVKVSLEESLMACLSKRKVGVNSRGHIRASLAADVILTVKSHLDILPSRSPEIVSVSLSSVQNALSRIGVSEDYLMLVGDLFSLSSLVPELDELGLEAVGGSLLTVSDELLGHVVARAYEDLEAGGVEFFGTTWFEERENALALILTETVSDYASEFNGWLQGESWLLRRSEVSRGFKVVGWLLSSLVATGKKVKYAQQKEKAENLAAVIQRHKRRVSQSITRRTSTLIGTDESLAPILEVAAKPWPDKTQACRILESDVSIYTRYFTIADFTSLSIIVKLIESDDDFYYSANLDSYITAGNLQGFDPATLKILEALNVLCDFDVESVKSQAQAAVEAEEWEVVEEGKNENLRNVCDFI